MAASALVWDARVYDAGCASPVKENPKKPDGDTLSGSGCFLLEIGETKG